MTRFCGNCGAHLAGGDRVCGQCGTPVDVNESSAQGLNAIDIEKKKKIVTKVKAIIALVIVVCIVITGVKIISGFIGTKGLVRKIMTAYGKYDIDTIISLSSDIYYYNDNAGYVDEYFEYAVGKGLDSFEYSVGHKYKMSYEVNEIYDLSQRKQDEMLKNIGYEYPDFDVDIISKIAIANVKVTAKQGSKTYSRTVEITMSKERGSWKLLYLE